MAIVLLGLAFIVYLDARMLRRLCRRSQRDARLFNDVFNVSPVLTVIIAGLILFHLAIVEKFPTGPAAVPFYRFIADLPSAPDTVLNSVGGRDKSRPVPTETETLVSDAYNVILIWFLAMVVIGAF